ncbi:zinc finger BED domain-containing protein 4-like [Dermacentor silvarum]|nr:zinc finger BED domain-containing protein 4-like [Dermacentor silvarum]
MTKAFNMTEHFGEEWLDRVPDEEGSESEHSFQEPPEPVGEEITSIASFHRVRCAAHTLQLAVNAALRKDEGAKEILALINATVNVFRRSCYWTERLKVLCGKDLIPPAGTRWNSLVAALKRLTEIDVFNSVMEVLKEYNESNPTRRISVSQMEMNSGRFCEILALLRPLADATDRLQSDGVTSCDLHISISSCYAQINNCRTSEFPDLKNTVLEELNNRFEEVLYDDFFVASSVLHPRQKLRVFNASVAPGLAKPTANEATAAVERLLEAHVQGPAATADKASSQQAQCDVGQEGIGDARDPYALLDVVCPTAHHEQSELDRYLSSTSTADDVLAYWHKHGETFPRLAKLAVVCLGVPASSGAVERLFSTAGALQRARRASLAPRTVEQLVLVSEHIRKGSSGK